MTPITSMLIGPLYKILDEVNRFCQLISVDVLFVEIEMKLINKDCKHC